LSEGTFDQLYISGTDYNWINDGQISMVVSTAGKTLTVIRGTPINAPLVGWTDGSNIDASDLLIADRQNLYAVQESLDKANVSVSISLSTSQQLEGQVVVVNQQVEQQNAALLAQVNAANAALLAQVTAANAAVTAQLAGVNTSLADVRLIASGAGEVGDISYTTSPTNPLGWGPAIGATVSRVAFAELFLKHGTSYGAGDGSTTFVAGPDLRGVVLRGLDNGRGLDPNRAKGSYQADQNKEIVIPYRQATPANGTGDIASNLDGTGREKTYGAGQEARMKNVAERAIMKYYSLSIQVNLNATTTPPRLAGKDPGYGSVILHLPLTSATGFTDVSGRSLSVTPGNVSISTTVGRWGAGSASFSGAAGAWISAALADIIGEGDYTIRFWARKPSYSSNRGLFYFYDSVNSSNLFLPRDSFTLWGGMASDKITVSGHNRFFQDGPQSVPANDAWAFVQHTRTSEVARTTVNGNLAHGVSNAYPDSIVQTLLAIGTYDSTSRLWIGNINDFQVSLAALPHVVPTGPLPTS
jgi:microcystin-dependent protein